MLSRLLRCLGIRSSALRCASSPLQAVYRSLTSTNRYKTIFDLSPELLSHILGLAYLPTDDLNALVQGEGAAHAEFLSNASLVCRDWKEEAQRLSWQEVVLNSKEQALAFVGNDNWVWSKSSRILALYGGSYETALPGDLAAEVLLISRGVETLFMG